METIASDSTISSLAIKAEFNDTYNHFHCGNYEKTIKLVEKYAARESMEIHQAVFQFYRLFSFYSLSLFEQLSSEAMRLYNLASNPSIKQFYKSFLGLTTSTPFSNENITGIQDKCLILKHYISLVQAAYLIKAGLICEAISNIQSIDGEPEPLANPFILERYAILLFSHLKIHQTSKAVEFFLSMKQIHVDAVPTLVASLLLNIVFKNFSNWDLKIEHSALFTDLSLKEAYLAIRETIESYGNSSKMAQLDDLCSIAMCLLDPSTTAKFSSTLHGRLNSLSWINPMGDIPSIR